MKVEEETEHPVMPTEKQMTEKFCEKFKTQTKTVTLEQYKEAIKQLIFLGEVKYTELLNPVLDKEIAVQEAIVKTFEKENNLK